MMSHTILIVDDSAVTRAMIRRTLLMAGFGPAGVFEAADGLDALAVLELRTVDLVLADLHMPKMGGIEMTRRLLANEATRHIPVVVVSAEPSDQKLDELKKEGVRGCIRKPFTPEALRHVVVEILEASNDR
jgi:two-component system chemotaxis response regulator CheY